MENSPASDVNVRQDGDVVRLVVCAIEILAKAKSKKIGEMYFSLFNIFVPQADKG